MKSSKNIKVYGTLVNHTLDSTLADETHNDALMNAYQLFDGRFGDSPLPNNFQDVINKRVTDITFDGGTTTIENRDEVPENHYTLVVNGDTNLNGDVHVTEDLHVDGDTYVDGDTHIDGGLYVTGDISGISLGDLDNVNKNADSASTGTFLKYNGSEWIPASIALSDTLGNIGNPFEGAILKYKNGAWTLTVDEDHDTNHLNNMHDVDISNISNGSILKWNTSTDMWEIGSDLGSILPQGQEGKVLKYINGNWVVADDLVGATKMSELSDVDTTGIAVDKILKWNGTKWVVADDNTGGGTQLPAGSEGKVLKYINGSWVAGDDNDTKQLSALNDVTLSTMAVGLVLRYDGSKWTNAKLSLDDLQMPAASNGQVLKFNGTKWVAGTDESSGGGNSGVVYRKYTVTLTKVAQRNGIVDGDSYSSSDDLRGRIYPGQNNAYFYVSDSPLVLGSGETLYQQYISLSQFGTVPYIKTFSQNYELAHPNGTQSTVATLDGNNVVDASVPSATNRYFLSNTLSTTTSSLKPYTDSLDCTFNNQNTSVYYTFDSNFMSWNIKKGDFYCPLFSGPYRLNVNAQYTDPTHNLEVSVIENGLIYTYTGRPNNGYKYSALYAKYTQSVNSSNRHTVTATTVSQSDIINKLNLTNNSIFVEVGANKVFAGIIASSDYSMPNTITAVITTQEIIGIN